MYIISPSYTSGKARKSHSTSQHISDIDSVQFTFSPLVLAQRDQFRSWLNTIEPHIGNIHLAHVPGRQPGGLNFNSLHWLVFVDT